MKEINIQYIEKIKQKLDNIIEQNLKQDKLEILSKFFENKVEYLFNNEYNKIIKKKEEDKLIAVEKQQFKKQFKNIFYNKFLGLFYLHEKGKFKIINYDLVTIQIHQKLDTKNLLSFKNKIYYQVKNSLKNKNFLDYQIENKDENELNNIFKGVFLNTSILKYFYYFIGSCLNNQDFNLFQGNIIFFGNHAYQLIEILKYYIYDVTKLYIRSLSDIKFRYNNYNFKTAILFQVDIDDFEQLKTQLKQNKELFMSICHYYFTHCDFIHNNIELEPIFYLNQFNNKVDFFQQYINENTLFDPQEELKIGDIYINLSLYLRQKNLPLNLITQKDVNSIMIDKYQDITTNKKYVYHLKLINYNKLKLVQKYVTDQFIIDENNYLNLNEINFFFKKWYKNLHQDFSCLTKNEIKKYLLFIISEKQIKDNCYYNYKLINYDKKKIFQEFCQDNIIVENNQNIHLIDVKPYFDQWITKNYSNIPEINMTEIKYYLQKYLSPYDQNIFGWKNYKFKIS